MNLREETVSTAYAWEGKLLHIRKDTARLPNGQLAVREVVEHPGGVGVVALTDENDILLVRQFRYPYGEILTEIPAGKRDPGEEPLATGQRELAEETGMAADRFEPLGFLYPSPGYTDEVIYLYLATGLHPTAAHPDDDEFLDVIRLPLTEAVRQVLDGTLPDAKTQIAILKAYQKIKQTEDK